MYNPQLETFIRVADAGSFNKAAEQLYISPPAIIKQINSLEASLGLELFVRTHRGLHLTEAGKSLYQDSVYIIEYCNESAIRAKNAMQQDDNVVRIGTSPMTPGNFLMGLWPKIYELCPGIKFQLVPFENTPQNAVNILRNLGKDIDVVAGVFDADFLKSRGCAALELSKEPIRCALSIHHRLAFKEKFEVEDLHGENFMLIRRGWNHYLDMLRDELWEHHPQIHVEDFDFFSIDVFNKCQNGDDLMMTIDNWKNVHPLLKVVPVEWGYIVPFGLLHSPKPSETVRQLLDAVKTVMEL